MNNIKKLIISLGLISTLFANNIELHQNNLEKYKTTINYEKKQNNILNKLCASFIKVAKRNKKKLMLNKNIRKKGIYLINMKCNKKKHLIIYSLNLFSDKFYKLPKKRLYKILRKILIVKVLKKKKVYRIFIKNGGIIIFNYNIYPLKTTGKKKIVNIIFHKKK